MTELQRLAELLSDLISEIEETDREQPNDDAECGVVEGKLAAYRWTVKKVLIMIEKSI